MRVDDHRLDGSAPSARAKPPRWAPEAARGAQGGAFELDLWAPTSRAVSRALPSTRPRARTARATSTVTRRRARKRFERATRIGACKMHSFLETGASSSPLKLFYSII